MSAMETANDADPEDHEDEDDFVDNDLADLTRYETDDNNEVIEHIDAALCCCEGIGVYRNKIACPPCLPGLCGAQR